MAFEEKSCFPKTANKVRLMRSPIRHSPTRWTFCLTMIPEIGENQMGCGDFGRLRLDLARSSLLMCDY